MREINKKEVVLRLPCENRIHRDKLFYDKNGDYIVSGDGVEFYYISNSPKFGYIDTYKNLRIACFDQVFNKWEYYNLI